jgi:hypothetical protein
MYCISLYQNHDGKIADRCFKNVAQFKYFGTTVTDQNLIQDAIKRKLTEFAQCLLTFSLEPFRLVSKSIKIRMYKTIIFRMFLYMCETWSLTLREEHGLRMFENREF